eukprot:6172651-Pleurochrysis_carterae.AAC.6
MRQRERNMERERGMKGEGERETKPNPKGTVGWGIRERECRIGGARGQQTSTRRQVAFCFAALEQ